MPNATLKGLLVIAIALCFAGASTAHPAAAPVTGFVYGYAPGAAISVFASCTVSADRPDLFSASSVKDCSTAGFFTEGNPYWNVRFSSCWDHADLDTCDTFSGRVVATIRDHEHTSYVTVNYLEGYWWNGPSYSGDNLLWPYSDVTLEVEVFPFVAIADGVPVTIQPSGTLHVWLTDG